MKELRGWKQRYDHLWLTVLTPEMHSRTCGYWYTVTDHATAHTAFRTIDAFRRWMLDRGLTLENESKLVPKEYGNFRIVGAYSRNCASVEPWEWDELDGVVAVVRELSNGQYTTGKITVDENGERVVNYLNPNERWRQVYDYRESQQAEDAGVQS